MFFRLRILSWLSLLKCVVKVSVRLVGWSVICYKEVVEDFRPNAHCQKSILVTILTSTVWR